MVLLRSISTFGSLTLVSRVLGFVRDILLASFLGASLVADCFFVAFKLPNFFRRLFAEGAFNAAFVPLFCGILGDRSEARGRARAKRFAEEALAVLLPILLLFTALMQVTMPWVMVALAPGFVDDPEKFDLAVDLTRSTFPYLMLISLVSLMAGVLNSLNRFVASASAPILLNLCLIGSILFFHDNDFLAGRALARAVTVAGIAQLVWLAVAMHKAGMSLRLRWPRLTPKVKSLGIIMLPAALGAGAVQVNLVIDIILASLLPEGSLSYLFYADRLNQLPIGVIGVAVGTVLLPAMSRKLAEGETAAAIEQQNRAMEAALFLTVPAAVALAVIPGPLITVLFERGAFDSGATAATAMALSAYAAGLPAYVLIKILTPGFFSRHDTRTPVKISLVALAVNIVLNVILMIPFKHVGLALATAISAWVNVGLLYLVLRQRDHFEIDARLRRKLVGIGAASAGMGLSVFLLAGYLSAFFAGSLAAKIAGLAGLILAGLVVYGLLAWVFRIFRTGDIRQLLGRS